ncbi:hypothetical protein CP973_10345 [Streptomyces albofaciens JCM 4342]|nr:hypothetical protein CP973_10345 [Streptomyces albofaciens JCM 4342]
MAGARLPGAPGGKVPAPDRAAARRPGPRSPAPQPKQRPLPRGQPPPYRPGRPRTAANSSPAPAETERTSRRYRP